MTDYASELESLLKMGYFTRNTSGYPTMETRIAGVIDELRRLQAEKELCLAEFNSDLDAAARGIRKKND